MHDSSRFGLTSDRSFSFLLAKAAFWRDGKWRLDVHDGMDDIALALALAADAWSRTGHVHVQASAAKPVTLRSGIVLEARPMNDAEGVLPLDQGRASMQQLERTLCEIDARFGAVRREWVMIELEYGASIECRS